MGNVAAIPRISFHTLNLQPEYTPLNPGGLGRKCFLLRLTNYCVISVHISYDGINDHDFLGKLSSIEVYNIGDGFDASTVIYARSDTGTGNGIIYLCGYYIV